MTTFASALSKIARGSDPSVYPQDGIHTTIAASYSADAGPTDITVSDATNFPRGSGSSEKCFATVVDKNNPKNVKEQLSWVSVSGNILQTCTRLYGAAMTSGDSVYVGWTGSMYLELVDVLETLSLGIPGTTLQLDQAVGGVKIKSDTANGILQVRNAADTADAVLKAKGAQVGENADAASADNVGTFRYNTVSNLGSPAIVKKMGANRYGWVSILDVDYVIDGNDALNDPITDEGARILIRTANLQLAVQNFVFPEKGKVLFDSTDGGPIIDPNGFNFNTSYVDEGGRGDFSIAANDVDLSGFSSSAVVQDVEDNPNLYKFHYRGKSYTIVSADQGINLITIDTPIGNPSNTGKAGVIVKNPCSGLHLSGPLNITDGNSNNIMTMRGLEDFDFNGFILNACNGHVRIKNCCAGNGSGNFGTLILDDDGTTGHVNQYPIYATYNQGIRHNWKARNHYADDATSRWMGYTDQSVNSIFVLDMVNCRNVGGGVTYGIYGSRVAPGCIYMGHMIDVEASTTSVASDNVTMLLTGTD